MTAAALAHLRAASAKLRAWLPLLAVLAVALAAAILLYPSPAPPPPAQAAPPAPELRDIRIIELAAPRTVKTYPDAVKTKLALPADAQARPAEKVVTASQVPASANPYTLTTTLDLDTGESRSYLRQDPAPWFALSQGGELGLEYGLRAGQPVARLSLRQNLLQIRAVHIAAVGSLDSTGDYFAGIGAYYRW